MRSTLRSIILAAMTFSPFGVMTLTAGAVAFFWPTAPAVAQQSGPPEMSCPLNQNQLATICGIPGRSFDVMVFLRKTPERQPAACACTTATFKKVVPGDGKGSKDKAIRQWRGFSALHYDGSNCLELCSYSIGGTVGYNSECVAWCESLN